METEELKAGERYNFTLLYTGQSISNKFLFESPTGIHYILGLGDLEAISPISVPRKRHKNTASAPKYDPCRRFRDGDIVTPQEVNGRIFSGAVEELIGQNCVVVEDELECCNVLIRHGEDEYIIDPAYLELVTPVEEQEPYKCGAGIDAQLIFVNDELFAEFENEEDATRVCALLNAEHRKEQR